MHIIPHPGECTTLYQRPLQWRIHSDCNRKDRQHPEKQGNNLKRRINKGLGYVVDVYTKKIQTNKHEPAHHRDNNAISASTQPENVSYYHYTVLRPI